MSIGVGSIEKTHSLQVYMKQNCLNNYDIKIEVYKKGFFRIMGKTTFYKKPLLGNHFVNHTVVFLLNQVASMDNEICNRKVHFEK